MLVGLAAVTILAMPVIHVASGSPPEVELDRFTVERFVADGEGAWLSETLPTADVVLVGASIAADATVEVRAHDGEGWGPWLAFPDVHDHGASDHAPGGHGHHVPHLAAHPPDRYPDGHHGWGKPHRDTHDGRGWGNPQHRMLAGDASRDRDPLWVGPSERLQLRVHSQRPQRIILDTVAMPAEQMRSNQPASPGRGAALASGGNPQIIPRAAWDPDGECTTADAPESGEVRMAHIHHTVMYPTYEPEEADDVVRALCIFHTEARGFDDLGYNFMIDAFGRIYEGRAGGIDRAVVGSHAAGFNHVSAGISVMGDHETDPVSDETMRAIEELLVWLFTTHGVDPLGTAVVESTGGAVPGLTPYDEGEEVELPTIVGHRDTGTDTLCPGRYLYAALEDVPPRVADLIAATLQRIDPVDQPAAAGPPADVGEHVPAAGDPVDAPAPTLPVTGWGGIGLALTALGVALLAGERRWRGRPTGGA